MNDLIYHLPFWLDMPTKLPIDIPNFEGKLGEEPLNHLWWCASKYLIDDSIRLRIFQRTLISLAVKWYIGLPRGSLKNFNALTIAFLTHQLPVHYENDTKLLNALKQITSMYISDHIHEWRRRCRLVKIFIPDQIMAEWFLKSLLPKIIEDVAKGGVVTK